MKPVLVDNLYELKYEDLTNNPHNEISKLLSFLSEDDVNMDQAIAQINPSFDSYPDVLEAHEIEWVKHELSSLMKIYNY